MKAPSKRIGVLVRFEPEVWRQFRDYAAKKTIISDKKVTMQSLIEQFVVELLKNG